MSGATEIRRILVALDDSPGSLAAAEAAADLAALVEAELLGLFVEDAELLRLATSPLAREVDFLTASQHGLETLAVERQLRIHAGRARRALERIAGLAGIRWSFRVVRGTVAGEIVAAAEEADVVSLGRLGWSLRRKRLLGRTARELLSRRRGITLFSDRRVPVRGPVVVLYDGSAAGRRALALAVLIADRSEVALHVLVVGENHEELRREVAGSIDERAVDAWIEGLGRPDPASMTGAVCRRTAGVVIVPLGRSPLGEEHVQRLLEEVMCPVLVVS